MSQPVPDRLKILLLAAVGPLSLVLFLTVMLPLRSYVLVCWLDGSRFYAAGLRVAPGKPTHLTDGQPVGIVPDLVTGFGGFAIAVLISLALAAVVYALLRPRSRLR